MLFLVNFSHLVLFRFKAEIYNGSEVKSRYGLQLIALYSKKKNNKPLGLNGYVVWHVLPKYYVRNSLVPEIGMHRIRTVRVRVRVSAGICEIECKKFVFKKRALTTTKSDPELKRSGSLHG
jgi:hypothetical protein